MKKIFLLVNLSILLTQQSFGMRVSKSQEKSLDEVNKVMESPKLRKIARNKKENLNIAPSTLSKIAKAPLGLYSPSKNGELKPMIQTKPEKVIHTAAKRIEDDPEHNPLTLFELLQWIYGGPK